MKIRDLPNGRKFGAGFSHGQVVSFECKLGFELVGGRALRCIHGRWNSSVPVCKGEKTLLRLYKFVKRQLSRPIQECNYCVCVSGLFNFVVHLYIEKIKI